VEQPSQLVSTPPVIGKAVVETGCETYRPLMQLYDWNVAIAMAIMKAESGCNPNSDNTGLNRDGSNDKGLLQINSIHSDLISDSDRLVPEKNIQAAYEIYRGSGFRAWSTFNNGRYLKFL
jgi:soluble lytic murein transglycosylase-like protein